MINVPPEGSLAAHIIPIGESPANAEVAQGRPFVGPSGNKLKIFWEPVGLSRQDMRIMNVIDFQAPGNVMDAVDAGEIINGIVKLREEIERLEDPYVLVPMGNYATFALTGKGNVKASVRKAFGWLGEATVADKKAGITALRGSIYEYTRQDGRTIKVIPTIHPAALFRNPKWEKRCFVDWEKIAREAKFREIYRVPRRHITAPTRDEADEFVARVDGSTRLAVDIETWGHTLSCCGFAADMYNSITFPLVGREWDWCREYVRYFCGGPWEKVLHNGFYDWYWLAWGGIQLNNFAWDTMLMHHALDPADNHSLDYVSSIYCPDHVYWKDEAKDAEEIIKYATDLESLWVYNGIDCVRTRELLDILLGLLEAERMVSFYQQHYTSMFDPLIRTMLHGIRVDKKAQKTWRKRLKIEMKEIRAYLRKAAGEELFAQERKSELREPTGSEWEKLLGFAEYAQWEPRIVKGETPKPKEIDKEQCVELGYIMTTGKIRTYKMLDKKSFSPIKLKKFFYETLGLPKQTKIVRTEAGRERKDTLDEGAIRKMTIKYRGKIGDYGTKLLAYREKEGEVNDLKGTWDKDGRVRCSYTMLTEAGRLSSRKNPRGTGRNLQNVKR